MKIGNRDFPKKQGYIYIMGILNVTPDSFSDGGSYQNMRDAMIQVEKMIQGGADIIDIGGESTRPGHIPVEADEEMQRVIPIIKEIRKRTDIPISVDTWKASVAKEALENGADMINDIWGLKGDCELAQVVNQYQVPICLMHNRKSMNYTEFMADVVNDLQESIQIAKKAGISNNKIMLDPGVGFAKDYQMNLSVMKHVEQIVDMGYPVLLGTSRKSVIGTAIGLPVGEREEGTMATSVLAALKGCSFVRVHDVEKNRRALQMMKAILTAE